MYLDLVWVLNCPLWMVVAQTRLLKHTKYHRSFFWHDCHKSLQFKGPPTLHTKLQKMQLCSIHITTFVHHCNDFFNCFIYGQQFHNTFFGKIFAVVCVVCKGLHLSPTIFFVFNCLYYICDNCLNFFQVSSRKQIMEAQMWSSFLLTQSSRLGLGSLWSPCFTYLLVSSWALLRSRSGDWI